MTNEEFQKLVLKKLDKLDNLEEGQKNLELEVKNISKKLDGVVEQTADLTEFRFEVKSELEDIKTSISRIEIATADNWSDIARLK
ncbi:MAG: plasmid stabilization protein [Tissierella sp.]|nr:plasmid stabilization protein [Tissierella sp.]